MIPDMFPIGEVGRALYGRRTLETRERVVSSGSVAVGFAGE